MTVRIVRMDINTTNQGLTSPDVAYASQTEEINP